MAEARLGTRDDAANPHIWTAEAVYELVRTWPREAWPKSVEWYELWQDGVCYVRCFNGFEQTCLPDECVASLFVASGESWLMKHVHKRASTGWLCMQNIGEVFRIAVYICAEDEWTELGRGDSELAAISAAIVAGKKEGMNGD